MRTITQRFKVYKYEELSREAQAMARRRYEDVWGGAQWFRADEYITSLRKLAEHFGGRLTDFELDWSGGVCYSYATFDMPEMSTEETLTALLKLGSYNKRTLKGLGDCKLTGMSYDESAIDGFRIAFMRHGKSLAESMQEAFKTWFKAAQEDYAYDFGHEGAGEAFEANSNEFNEDGSSFRG